MCELRCNPRTDFVPRGHLLLPGPYSGCPVRELGFPGRSPFRIRAAFYAFKQLGSDLEPLLLRQLERVGKNPCSVPAHTSESSTRQRFEPDLSRSRLREARSRVQPWDDADAPCWCKRGTGTPSRCAVESSGCYWGWCPNRDQPAPGRGQQLRGDSAQMGPARRAWGRESPDPRCRLGSACYTHAMVSPAERLPTTAADYLALERSSTEKHELFHGEVFAMSGGTYEHNLIAGNVGRELGSLLRDTPCNALPSDMKVRIPATDGFVYPDVTVLCGQPEFHDEVRDAVTNPVLVVEVLSESTERYDRGDKFAGYRSVPSIQQVLLVSQRDRHVEHYQRQHDGSWLMREYRSSEVCPLGELGCALRLDEVYLKVEFRASRT